MKSVVGLRVSLLAGAAALSFGAIGVSGAKAQSTVSVCSGVSLPRSVVTDIVEPIADGIVSETQDGVNGVLSGIGISTTIGTISLTVPTLSLDIAGLVDDAATGDPITLQVLNSDGLVVGPDDRCDTTADSYQLDEDAGIAIGGNRITGLGEEGAPVATAAGLDSIAFGNGASTTAAAVDGIALGRDASVTAANSVALGADSLADRENTVSVGATGNLRQIVNVADGTQDSDAATVGQVNDLADIAVQYDSAAQGSVTLGGGAGGTTITNLAAGDLSPTSTDAVNGSQLAATNADVAANAADIGTLGGRVTVNEGDIADLQANSVQYDDAGQTLITLGGADGTVITNLADGTLSADSSDAVNGSQLFATNTAVAENTAAISENADDIADLDGRVTVTEDSLASLQANSVQYDDATQDQVTLGGAAGTTLSNVADGELSDSSTEAVNGGQLFDTNANVADNAAAITVNRNDIASIDGRVTVNEGNISSIDTRVSTIENTNTQQTERITELSVQMALDEELLDDLDATAVRYDDPTQAQITLGGAGGTVITNVAAGTVAPGSTDAVNGDQLAAVNAELQENGDNITGLAAALGLSPIAPVRYADADAPTQSNGGTETNIVTLVGADRNAPVRLTNVANGTAATDAANMGQLNAGLAETLSAANGYTDSRLDGLSFDLSEANQDAQAGIAGAVSIASLPQVLTTGGGMVAGAIGHYRGETAFAIGASKSSPDGKVVFRVNGTVDTRGYLSGGGGIGVGF